MTLVPSTVATARHLATWVARDVINGVTHRGVAPRCAQRIWIVPSLCDRAIFGYGSIDSGTILDGDWDRRVLPFESLPKVKFCRARWENDVPWERTGAFEYVLERIVAGSRFDDCKDRDDIVRRFAAIDEMFAMISREKRVRPRSELPGRSFREAGGIRVHIDRDLSPVFGGSGTHRLAIAHILGIPRVPAMVGVVHANAVVRWRREFATGP